MNKHLLPKKTKKRQTAKGFDRPKTKRFGIEIVARCELSGDETEIEIYSPTVEVPRGKAQCPPGYKPHHVAMEAAIQLAHLRIYELYWRQSQHPAHFTIDARIWSNPNRSGMPVVQVSTAPFRGAVSVPLIDTDNPNRALTDDEVAEIEQRRLGYAARKL